MRPDYATIGIVLASLFFILQVASLIITIWQRLRRQPPIDQTLRDYVLKREFEKHVESNERVQTQLFDLQRAQTQHVGDEIKGLRESLSTWQNGVAPQIGNMEGRIASMERKPKGTRSFFGDSDLRF